MSTIFSGVNWLDVLFLTILLGMIYKGSRTGVGSQFLSLAWLLILVYVSICYYDTLAAKIFGFMAQNWARPIAFFVIFFVFILVIKFFEMIFNVSNVENLAPIERIGGAVIASLRAFLLLGLVSTQLLLLPGSFLRDSVAKGSKTGMMLVNLDVGIYCWMSSHLKFVKVKKRTEIIEEILASSENN